MNVTVDLRSDTVTLPTAEMLAAMASAPLGDDVLGHDPTVFELEQECAAMTGHEAGLFCPSGTMTNQVALATWCRPGDSALFEEEAHMVYYEAGAPAVLAGVMPITLPSNRGVMSLHELERRFMSGNLHTPGTTLLCIENTHNRTGGAVISVEQTRQYQEFAQSKGIKLHLDGARVFNAATALGVDVRELTAPCDSVSICLSKGLGAPVGSVLCGPSEFIERAKFVRKRFGGGMRQAGVLAAAGLVGLRVQSKLLGEDHRRARDLNARLQGIPGTRVDPDETVTNFVFVHTERPAAEWSRALKERGVLCMPAAPHRIRLVLHHQISDEMLDMCAAAFRAVSL
ncbi:MAG: aminotransferase class I/II-fold pyridoxal phosphate-dependent enzyme [Chthonomonas sp.]|nr:aminotransferase class I/II-fold pyridoxal phosphate-dependent enzyme [Chthonomonas sp.]